MTDQSIQDTWSSGDYEQLATDYLSLAGHLVEEANVGPDDEVLDIGCGTGSVTISAARHEATVTGVDIIPELLEGAERNVERAGVDGVTLEHGDAIDLPCDDNSFDVVLSSLGHMYGDPPDAAASELVRVTKPDGRIGFTSWTPTSLFPFMAGVFSAYLPPEELPDYSEPPFMWGDSDIVESRLDGEVETLEFETATAYSPAMSPTHCWDVLKRSSGVFKEFLEVVPTDERGELEDELVDTIETYFDDRQNAVELEYLLTIAIM